MSDPSTGSGTDPDVTLPPAVRRAAAEAERLAAEATAEAQAEQGQRDQQAEGGPDTPVVNPDATPGFDHAAPELTVYAPKSEVRAPAQQEGSSAPQRDASYWEHRCRTLQGKYDSEVPALTARLRHAETEATELRGRVGDLTAQLYQARQAYQPTRSNGAGGPSQGPVTADIPEEDIEAYGQDFIEKVRGWTRPPVDVTEITQLKQKLERIENQTASQQQEAAQQGVRDYLTRRIPNWEELNSHSTFMEWVQRPDPFSGVNRLELMRQAFTRGDAQRTAAFFEAFLAEHTAVQPPGTHRTQNPAYAGAGTVPLAELTAPGRGRPAMATGASDKPDFTHRQIDQFYADVARGKYRFDEAERVRIEKLIHLAAAENRVR